MRKFSLMALVALFALIGCSYLESTTKSNKELDTSDLPEVWIEGSELELEALPPGCVATVAELSLPYHIKPDDEHLLADRLIVVRKEARRVMLFTDSQLRHDRPGGSPDCWKIALGVYSDGRPSHAFDKAFEGDRHTPVGLFRLSDKPWSNYYGAMLVHYPDSRHAQQAFTAGRVKKSVVDAVAQANLNGTAPPQNTPLGGDILIHGGGSWRDWTWGCIALANHDIDELRGLLPKGMKTWVLIVP